MKDDYEKMKTHTSQTTATHVAMPTLLMRATSKARKATLLLFSVAVLLASGATAVRGQSALDGFDPNASNTVQVVVVQPDGKTLIGGQFTSVLGVTRNRIARLNPDGTLDTAFDPNADGAVESIAVQADGKILVGGFFSTIGGQTRNRIARLDPVTGQADSFDPNADFAVESIAVQGDGQILAGGGFSSIGGQTRNHIARLDAVTGLADSFNPNADDSLFAIAVQADGRILVGGIFSSIGGADARRHRPARCHDRSGRFVRPEREQYCPRTRGAGGWQDPGGRRFLRSKQHWRADAQSHRSPRSCDRSGRFV